MPQTRWSYEKVSAQEKTVSLIILKKKKHPIKDIIAAYRKQSCIKKCCLLCLTVIIKFRLWSGDLKLQHVHSTTCHCLQPPFPITGQKNMPCLGPASRTLLPAHLQPWQWLQGNLKSRSINLTAVSAASQFPSLTLGEAQRGQECWYMSALTSTTHLLPPQPFTALAILILAISSPGKYNLLFFPFKITLSQLVRGVFK